MVTVRGTARDSKAQDYYAGETWQYWIGPKPPADAQNVLALEELRRVFQQSNKVRECCDRVINGLVSKPFQWEIVSEAGDATENHGAELLVREWLSWVDEQSMSINGVTASPLWEVVRDLVVWGEGYLRMWMPARLSESMEPYQKILLSRVAPSWVTVKADKEGFIEEFSIATANGLERQVLDRAGNLTVQTRDGEATYQGIKTWFVFRMAGQGLITEDVISAQNSINLARTMEARSLIQNGFVERVLLNAQLPGQWVADDNSPNGQRFRPDPNGLRTGAGMTSFVQGNPLYNEMGQVSGYTNPSVSYNDPAPLDSYAQSVAGSSEIIYHAMGQGHLLASDSQMSGVARQVLRQDALLKISQYERVIVSALEKALTTFLRYSGFEGLRVSVGLRKAINFVSPEEKNAIIAEYNTGLISKATAIAMIGTVDDVDAELSLIEGEDLAAVVGAKERQTIIEPERKEDAPIDINSDDTAGDQLGSGNNRKTPYGQG
jgi:hypothetical protein